MRGRYTPRDLAKGMKIVLDTTTIRADYHLHSPTSLTFWNGLKLIPAKLCVPDLSISWDREDVLNYPAVRAWHGDDLNFTDASTSLNVGLRLGVDLVVDSDAGKVESEEVGVLGGPCGEFMYGAWDVQNEAWEEERMNVPDM